MGVLKTWPGSPFRCMQQVARNYALRTVSKHGTVYIQIDIDLLISLQCS